LEGFILDSTKDFNKEVSHVLFFNIPEAYLILLNPKVLCKVIYSLIFSLLRIIITTACLKAEGVRVFEYSQEMELKFLPYDLSRVGPLLRV
jgi:hypothetical protein